LTYKQSGQIETILMKKSERKFTFAEVYADAKHSFFTITATFLGAGKNPMPSKIYFTGTFSRVMLHKGWNVSFFANQKIKNIMNKTMKLIQFHFALIAAGALAVSTVASHAQGVIATISGVQDGANWDYTITLTDTGSTQIGNFWYAWTPDTFPFFYLPAGTISNISGANGWTGATSENSIQYVDNSSANALNPGDFVKLFYTASFSPTDLANTSNSGRSVAYSGSGTFVENGASTGDFTVTPVAAPEPTSLALLGTGLAGLAFIGRRIKK
jgi:hypothetical protein